MNTPTQTLKGGAEIPQLGLGTWQLTGEDCAPAIKNALDIGYRHIDTAYHYGNHEEVGEAIADSDVPREDIFLTTKMWFDHADEAGLKQQLNESLEDLDTDYVDLLLLHWPSETSIEETLSTMEALKEDGKIKAYGVSNFTIEHLEGALETGYAFSNNQVEFHPSFNQKELKNFCDENDIVLTAYSPLGRTEDLELPEIAEIAEDRDVAPSQVIINWLLKKGIVAIPKATSRDHLEANFKALDWELTDEEFAKIENIEKHERMIDPDFADFD